MIFSYFLEFTKGNIKKDRLPKTEIIIVCDVHIIHPNERPESYETLNEVSIIATENG